MPKYLLVLTLFLSACTVARYGESFEKHATHIEKDYNKPFDELYTCLLGTGAIMPDDTTYSTPTSAVYAKTGFTNVTFKKTGPNKTHVRASGLTPYWDPQMYITALDKCAAK